MLGRDPTTSPLSDFERALFVEALNEHLRAEFPDAPAKVGDFSHTIDLAER